MGKHPKLCQLDSLFDKGMDFSLTDAQYENKVGIPLPKQKSYIIDRSALAKKSKEKGYTLRVQEKTVYFIKEAGK